MGTSRISFSIFSVILLSVLWTPAYTKELTTIEMRASYEKDKARAVSEARRTAQVELETAVKATKAKQWCANCSQEAQFYCCWNTSYCDYPCQKAHWNTHYAQCTQQRNTTNNGDNGNSIEKRLQPAPENPPNSDEIKPKRLKGERPRTFETSRIHDLVTSQHGVHRQFDLQPNIRSIRRSQAHGRRSFPQQDERPRRTVAAYL